MSEFSGITWPVILSFINLIFSSAIVITAFALLGYMLTHNLRSAVAQSFSVLLACVLVVFAGDIVIPRATTVRAADIWLRVQWIGIAMVPAAYLHFSHAVLQSTRHFSARRRVVVALSYDGQYCAGASCPVYGSTGLQWRLHAADQPAGRRAALPTFRGVLRRHRGLRRLEHHPGAAALPDPGLAAPHDLSDDLFAAPGLAVFPYLVTAGLTSGLIDRIPTILILLMVMAANIIVGAMLVLMAYSVAFLGVLSPDRVIKHDLVHYLLRGPVVGTVVIAVMLVIPRVEVILGLPVTPP